MALLKPNFHFGKLIRYYEVPRPNLLSIKTVISYAQIVCLPAIEIKIFSVLDSSLKVSGQVVYDKLARVVIVDKQLTFLLIEGNRPDIRVFLATLTASVDFSLAFSGPVEDKYISVLSVLVSKDYEIFADGLHAG